MNDPLRAKRDALIEIENLIYSKASKNFSDFFISAWPTLEPGMPLKFNWHHELVAEYLTAAYNREIKRLIINMPPRYSKSLEVTVAFPCWAWTLNPALRFMATSYSGGLSVKHSVNRRYLIESPFYQKGWGDRFKLTTDQNQKSQFENDKRGSMLATSMQGTATGLGGNFLIVDDPHDTTRAASDIKRESDIEAFDQKFTTRLDDKENDVIIVVMQRLDENDLTGHLLSKMGWTHVSLPAINDKDKIISFPISKRKKSWKKDELLHPEREDKTVLAQVKEDLGSYGFSGQYLQDPSPREGGILKKAYWRFYKEAPKNFDLVIQSWDLSFKDLQTSDFVVGQIWGLKGANKYLLDQYRAQANFPNTKRAIIDLTMKWSEYSTILIEDKANGPAIIAELTDKISGILEWDPGGKSKVERAVACEPQLEAGNVYLPHPALATWVEDFIDRCAKFPKVKKDDEIDAMTQALIYLKGIESNNYESLLQF